jgi:hypothetical protein
MTLNLCGISGIRGRSHFVSLDFVGQFPGVKPGLQGIGALQPAVVGLLGATHHRADTIDDGADRSGQPGAEGEAFDPVEAVAGEFAGGRLQIDGVTGEGEGVPSEKIGTFDEEVTFSRAPVGFVEAGA